MKQIKQFRFYGENHPSNYPEGLGTKELVNNNIFAQYGSITQMGIQGRPGTVLYLNNSTYPIVVGETGIYEIDLENYGQIYSIRFSGDSLKAYDNGNDRLLIDIIFEGASSV